MATEIERKFLLSTDDWRNHVERSTRLIQGYLSRNENAAIRVRVDGDRAELNIKHTTDGINRLEYEYAIPLQDAREMLDACALRPLIDKTRHIVRFGQHRWEIDEFHGENAGLIMAEIELQHAEEDFDRPGWIGPEVSTDKRYYNSNLSEHPFTHW